MGKSEVCYLYDGSDLVAELDASGNRQAVNTFGAQGLVSRHTLATNASVFYAFDERGNVAPINNKQPPGLTPETRRLFLFVPQPTFPTVSAQARAWGRIKAMHISPTNGARESR